MNKDIERITKIKIKLLSEYPFFGVLALYFNYEFRDDIESAATDGRSIFFNKNWIKKLTNGEVAWVTAHEIMHNALNHFERRKGRNLELFNVAADYAIHSILKDFEDFYFKMPEKALYSKMFKKMCAEDIYQYLIINKIKVDIPFDFDDHSLWDSSITQAEWDSRLLSAAKLAASRGKEEPTGIIKNILNKITPPKKDWRSLLNELIIPETFDYSFCPSDKRYSDSDFVIPDFNSSEETVENIAFFIDISGSVKESEVIEVYSEILGCINQFGNLKGYLGYFNNRVKNFTSFENIQDVLKNAPIKGGGTNFSAPFEYIRNNNLEVETIVVLTDGMAEFPDDVLYIPTLWIINNERDKDIKAPFGLTVNLKENIKV